MDTTRLIPLVLQSPAHRRIIELLDDRDTREHFGPCACATPCRVEGATDEANRLVDRGHDPIAATLLAFGRRPHAFTNAYRSMTGLLIFRAAFALGVDLDATPEALEGILKTMRECPSIEVAACWVATHLRFPSAGDDIGSEPSSFAAASVAH